MALSFASPEFLSNRSRAKFSPAYLSSRRFSATTLFIANGNMHLSPREIDKLLLHNAGFLAQKRLARGLRLNYPEAVALIATVLLEFIRDGKSVAELMDMGRQLLGRNQVMSGI